MVLRKSPSLSLPAFSRHPLGFKDDFQFAPNVFGPSFGFHPDIFSHFATLQNSC